MRKEKVFRLTILLLCFFLWSVFLSEALAETEETEYSLGILAEEDETPAAMEEVHYSFPAGVTAENLAENYIRGILSPGEGLLEAARPSGPIQFAEGTPSRKLYDLLRQEISLVAAGEKSSTVFEISAKDFADQYLYTAEELGVDSLFDEEEKITEDTKTAARQLFRQQFSFSDVVFCVMEDSPYELYWWDKTSSASLRYAYGYATNRTKAGILKVYVTLNVSQDYADLTEWDGGSPLMQVDTEKYGKVEEAREKIQEILTASEHKTDEEKIYDYAQTICDLASYHRGATANLPYGDPWQMIWVFDGDPDTKVVCEGYAKAFTHLCDLGTAEAEAISCQGYLNSTSTSQAHMWNIVAISGHNYLVDLTNYDLGYDLLMVGYTEGDVQSGYQTACGQKYFYNTTYTPRTEEELTLSPFDYQEWKKAAETAPAVEVSSRKTYPGYQIAIYYKEGKVPMDQMLLIRDGVEEPVTFENGMTLISVASDTEMAFRGITDGRETPVSDLTRVTVAPWPEEASFILPAGADIETEAFAGIPARVVSLNRNRVAAGAFTDCPGLEVAVVDEASELAGGAFDKNVTLAVKQAESRFGCGYEFIVESGEEENAPDTGTEEN